MKKQRIQSLDILRAVALVLICVYHWFSYKGTYIGVVIFFALSGYLVTGGLLSRDFSISLSGFTSSENTEKFRMEHKNKKAKVYFFFLISKWRCEK